MQDADDDRPARGSSRSASRTEAEVFLQGRLVLLHKLLFFLSGGILGLSVVLLGALHSWRAVPADLAQPHRVMHLVLVLFFGAGWFLGSRWRLRRPVLAGIDTAGLLFMCFAIAGMIAHADTGQVGAMEVVAAMLLVLAARAIIIPSSGKQTLILSLAAATLAIATFVWHALYRPAVWPHATGALRDIAITMALWIGMMVATASLASRIIFGLRREIRAAKRIGQYELLGKIGEGGMGVVYRATHALLRRDTALKLLPRTSMSPDGLARFEREVRQTARLTHPNTVAVFDYGRTPDGVFYYAMEYLDGVDLDRLVKYSGPLPVSRAVHLLCQVLSSLIEAHAIGLIHRDIKPANVIVTQRGGESDVVKVVDFGLVKDLRGAEDIALTSAGALAGTPLFLAPEIIRSPDLAHPAGDIYAVAALGYHLVTGTYVFSAGSVMEICAHHLHTPPEPPSVRLGQELPESFEAILLRGLDKSPERRFPNARAFREALQSCPDIPRWTDAEAAAWWAKHGDEARALHAGSPVDGSGRTVAVDLYERG